MFSMRLMNVSHNILFDGSCPDDFKQGIADGNCDVTTSTNVVWICVNNVHLVILWGYSINWKKNQCQHKLFTSPISRHTHPTHKYENFLFIPIFKKCFRFWLVRPSNKKQKNKKTKKYFSFQPSPEGKQYSIQFW